MEEFIAGCCEVDGKTIAQFRETYVALPCKCEAVEGLHWARIRLDAAMLCDHLAFHLPDTGELLEISSAETQLWLRKHARETEAKPK